MLTSLAATYHQDFPGTGGEHRFILLSTGAKQRKLRIVAGGENTGRPAGSPSCAAASWRSEPILSPASTSVGEQTRYPGTQESRG